MGEVAGLVQPVDGRNGRPRARGDDDAPCDELVPVYGHAVGPE